MNANLNLISADDAAIEAAFVPVPYDSKEWDEEDDHWTPDDATQVYTRTLTMKFFDTDGPYDNAPDANWDRLAPIAGGCENEVAHITEQPFEPSEEDWAEYRKWCEWVDQVDALNAERD